ncbi:MAG: ATP-binding protein, partial [Candidatus Eisenbacteria bacterium]
ATLVLGPVNVGEAIQVALQSVTPIAQKKNVTVEVHEATSSADVMADQHRLVQILVNLISNAVKFTDSGGHVRVDCAGAEEIRGAAAASGGGPRYVKVAVADNGPGIPKEELERVFDKFKQVADKVKGKPGGTGLGLAISRQLVQRMGGRIWAESEVGRGSCFSFTLPAATAETVAEQAEVPALAGQRRS